MQRNVCIQYMLQFVSNVGYTESRTVAPLHRKEMELYHLDLDIISMGYLSTLDNTTRNSKCLEMILNSRAYWYDLYVLLPILDDVLIGMTTIFAAREGCHIGWSKYRVIVER